WSPDGNWLAYVIVESLHVRPEAAGLFLARADGSAAKRLAGGPGETVFGMQWSADSKRLFFSRAPAKDADKEGLPAVDVIELDGRNLRRLATGADPAYVGRTYFLAGLLFRR